MLSFQYSFSKQEEEKRPFYNQLSFGLGNDSDVKTKGWIEINISIVHGCVKLIRCRSIFSHWGMHGDATCKENHRRGGRERKPCLRLAQKFSIHSFFKGAFSKHTNSGDVWMGLRGEPAERRRRRSVWSSDCCSRSRSSRRRVGAAGAQLTSRYGHTWHHSHPTHPQELQLLQTNPVKGHLSRQEMNRDLWDCKCHQFFCFSGLPPNQGPLAGMVGGVWRRSENKEWTESAR